MSLGRTPTPHSVFCTCGTPFAAQVPARGGVQQRGVHIATSPSTGRSTPLLALAPTLLLGPARRCQPAATRRADCRVPRVTGGTWPCVRACVRVGHARDACRGTAAHANRGVAVAQARLEKSLVPCVQLAYHRYDDVVGRPHDYYKIWSAHCCKTKGDQCLCVCVCVCACACVCVPRPTARRTA